MKQEKFRIFRVTLSGGETVEVKTPSRITVDYARINAWHYAGRALRRNVAPEEVTEVEGVC